MPTIRELLAANGLEHITEYIEAAAQPSVYLTSTEHSEDPCSRLGGRPNLPQEIEWPTWAGNSLPFIAQLDLAAIPKIQGFDLPEVGALYFFSEGGTTAWGFSPRDRGSSLVLYAPGTLAEHSLRDLPNDLEPEMRFSGITLHPSAAQASLPDVEDLALLHLLVTAEERRQYLEFFCAWREHMPPTVHRLGGYPEPIQSDPRLLAQLVSHGIDCGDSSGYSRGKELGLWPGAADWQVLLQVDSDERAGMMWGDVGRLYFLIRQQDLSLRAFEKTWLAFQCS